MEDLSLLPIDIRDQLAEIGSDRVSGATALVLKGVDLLRRASAHPDLLRAAGCALVRSQPAMAGFSTAFALALTAEDPVLELETFEHHIRSVPTRIANVATSLELVRHPSKDVLRVVTCSRSATVEMALLELNLRRQLQVSCSESRPAREGVSLARALLDARVPVVLYSDAGISSAIPTADAVFVGADSVGGRSFINKVGTGALCALASSCRVPVLVFVGREKILPESVYGLSRVTEGPAVEVDEELASSASNPYFERVPIELVRRFVTDREAVDPEALSGLTLWSEQGLHNYMSVMRAYNMLDRC